MPEEPCSPHGWTLDTLETHLSSRITGDRERLNDKIEAVRDYATTNFQQVKERTDMALAASEKAVTKAEVATEKRFDAVNEFRGAMDDQAKSMVPRAEYLVHQAAVVERINNLAETVNTLSARLVGKTEGIGHVGTIIIGAAVAINTLVALAALVMMMRGH